MVNASFWTSAAYKHFKSFAYFGISKTMEYIKHCPIGEK